MSPSLNSFWKFAERFRKNEKSSVVVKKEAFLRIALIFPNSYEVGMSNLGFQEVYRLFNNHPAVSCERGFLYPSPFHSTALTIESGKKLREFDIVAFSVSFELDYSNLIQILANAQLPLRAADRGNWEPLIICGGVISFLNPVPLSQVIDVFLIGEAKPLIDDFLQVVLNYKEKGLKSLTCMEELAEHKSFWLPAINSDIKKQTTRIRKQQSLPIQSSLISPFSHFKNMHLIEVGRACGRGCRFCAAGYVYRPVCFFAKEKLIEMAQQNPFQAKRIGLVGSALSDYPELFQLCEHLVNNGYELGLSSFRLDMISSQFIELLKKASVKSLTLAPEAGSQRLRQIIHKQLTEEQILAAMDVISNSAIKSIKFYFMIGLPTEVATDIEAIVALMQKVLKILDKSFKISISINAFIPKPGTPFQWSVLAKEKDLNEKRRYLTNEFRKLKRISFVPKSSRIETVQALLSLGNTEVGSLIIEKVAKNLRWNLVLKNNQELLNRITYQEKDFEAPLPWNFLTTDQNQSILKRNWLKVKNID